MTLHSPLLVLPLLHSIYLNRIATVTYCTVHGAAREGLDSLILHRCLAQLQRETPVELRTHPENRTLIGSCVSINHESFAAGITSWGFSGGERVRDS